METKDIKVVIYEPEILFWGVAAGFHGYAIEFINQYADCIYLNKRRIGKDLGYKVQLWKMGIKRHIRFIHSLEMAPDFKNVLIGFTVPLDDDDEILKFKGKKYFHLMDYYLFVSRNQIFLKKYGIDKVIGHTQMDINCDFFKKYYPEYIGKVISLPFGYQSRFKCKTPFNERKNIAVGLGSINPVNDPLLEEYAKKEFLEYYKNDMFMHPLRRFIQINEEYFNKVVDVRFPTSDKQKDFSYDAVKMLNNYKMFINDAGLANFPPARTYEGIACGCVMVAEDNEIYRELGFIPNVNYIAFEKNNYEQLKERIFYYQKHEDELSKMQEKSLQLSKKYVHSKIADDLYKILCDE